MEIRLSRNVQFIYENALACTEFEVGFGAENLRTIPSDPWLIHADVDGNPSSILERSAYAGEVNGDTAVYSQLIRPAYQGGRFNQTRSVNQYLTHWIYPYKGKFHPQMIRALLNIMGARPGWTVLDPFMGSGTTALECQMLGIDCIGVDVSPLCALLTKVKTNSWQHWPEIEALLDPALKNKALDPNDSTLQKKKNETVCDFLKIGEMVTLSDASNRKRDAKTWFPRRLKNMLESARAMDEARHRFGLRFGEVRSYVGDVKFLDKHGIESASIDGIVTSPPYSLALDYVHNDKHALEAMGEDLGKIRERCIGLRGRGAVERLHNYNSDMRQALAELARVLKPGGRAVVIIGDATVKGEEVTTTKEMVRWAREAGLVLERTLPKIVYGLYNVVADEKILFFRRDPLSGGKSNVRSDVVKR